MKHNIPLNILDNYARTISSSQANMLYEHKLHKKFKKPLYEKLKYQSDDNFKIYLSEFVLNNAKSSINEALLKYVNKHKLQYNIVDNGVYLYTPLAENYISLLENLINDGFDLNVLKDIANLDKGTMSYLKQVSEKK